MKTGIITFVNAPNFGALLQSYASSEYLTNEGHDVTLINYAPSSGEIANGNKNPLISKLDNLVHLKKYMAGKEKSRKLLSFKSKYLKLTDKKYTGNIDNLDEDFDVIIAGSDQIWNTQLNCGNTAFYLDFSTNAKKIGYAVSVGRKLTDDDKNMICKYADTFELISARESSLQKYINENYNTKCELVCDPVFLLDKNKWKEVSAAPNLSGYILIYAMEYNNNLVSTAEKISKKTGKKIISISGYGTDDKRLPGKLVSSIGPDEFIGYIENADIVLTNSFHGAAFSVIFGSDLLLFKHSTRNERLAELMDKCGASDKIIASDFSSYDYEKYILDTKAAYNNMKGFIENSKDFLGNING